jgi:TPR repeat protein
LIYTQAASLGHKRAEAMLANLLVQGFGAEPQHAANAASVAAGRCPLGNVEAQQVAIDKWNTPEQSLAAIRAAAEGGNLAAQYVLGSCFKDGMKGALRDGAQAVVWWHHSANGNVAEAQFNLSFMHKFGLGGLTVNLVESARLYALAAAQGLATAQCNLGICYREGEGVPRDLAEASRLFRAAAEQGDADAQAALR